MGIAVNLKALDYDTCPDNKDYDVRMWPVGDPDNTHMEEGYGLINGDALRSYEVKG
jgi:hypothetical protein